MTDVVATLSEVRAAFSQYLARAETQRVIITRCGQPVVVLVSVRELRRLLGTIETLREGGSAEQIRQMMDGIEAPSSPS